MKKDLQTTEAKHSVVTIVDDSIINEYLKSMGNNLTEKHRTQFVQIAKAFNLNPFTREIYGIQYGNNFNIIVGYEVYLKRAERSGKLDGWEVFSEGSKEAKDLRATCVIYRKDRAHPIKRTVYFTEYTQNNQMWNTKSRTMIEKVAIATAFRQAFPDELSGMPYTEAETVESEVIAEPKTPKSSRTKLSEKLVRMGIPIPVQKSFSDFCGGLNEQKIDEYLNDIPALEEMIERFKSEQATA